MGRNALLYLVQLLVPHSQTLRKLTYLLRGEHPWLDPCDLRLLVYLIEGTTDELQTMWSSQPPAVSSMKKN